MGGLMDDFASRAYNKACAAEQSECETQVKKGIVLNGKATGQKGAASYPTDGKERILGCVGANSKEENMEIEENY